MASITPVLTATPGAPPTYNVGIAETFSWIPVEGAGRPLFARATYLANPEDISISLSAGDINVNLEDVENGVNAANNLLNALTSVDYATEAKQTVITSLLNVLTANTDGIESSIDLTNTRLGILTAVDYATAQKQDLSNTLLETITAANINVPGFKIPPYDEIDLNYVGSTNNIETVAYKNSSTTVMTLSFVYVPNPPTADNALLKTVKKL